MTDDKFTNASIALDEENTLYLKAEDGRMWARVNEGDKHMLRYTEEPMVRIMQYGANAARVFWPDGSWSILAIKGDAITIYDGVFP